MAYVWVPIENMENDEVRDFAARSNAVIEKLLEEGLYVDTYEDVTERREAGEENWVGEGLVHHPELGALVQEATSKDGKLNMLERRLLNCLRPHLSNILAVSYAKYDHEKNRQKFVYEALTAFENGECPIINGLIIKKENPAPEKICLIHYQN